MSPWTQKRLGIGIGLERALVSSCPGHQKLGLGIGLG